MMNVFSKLVISATSLLLVSTAHAQSVHGVLRVVKGDVQIKTSKGETTKARIGGKVFPKDTVITGKDARAKIVMVDNNEINVSPESQIEIQHYEYDPNGGKKDVLLNVIYGKVRSKVEQKYDGKTSKFQIKTPSAVAGVRGTDFLMGYNSANNSSQVVTFEGKVEFGLPGPGGSITSPVVVTPGQMASNNAGQAPAPPAPMPKEDLAKMDTDSKSDLPKVDAPGGAAEDQRAPAADDKKEKKDGAAAPAPAGGAAASDEKKTEGKDNAAGGGSAPANNRAPGSARPADGSAPAQSPGGMFRPEDFANNSAPTMPMMGPAIPGLLPQIPINSMPPCDFCQSLIQDGQTKLIIRVNGS